MELSTAIIIACITSFDGFVKADSNITLPTFEWDLDYFNNHDRLKVRGTVKFNNGQADDTINMVYTNPFKVHGEPPQLIDRCIFKGKLYDEKVPITMVGCPDHEQQEIVFKSEKLEEDMFIVVNGTTTALMVDESNAEEDVSNGNGNPLGKRSLDMRGILPDPLLPLPEHMILNISVDFDREFSDTFKADSYNEARRMLSLAQQVFEFPSLGTKIRLVPVGDCYVENFRLNAGNERHLAVAQNFAEKSKKMAHIYLYFSRYNGNYFFGKSATVGSVCSRSRSKRTAIVENHSTSTFSARQMARQIGHLLGMWPDYLMSKGVRSSSPPRYDRTSVSCTNQGGMMDFYGSSRNKWTVCSREDFRDYYNHIIGAAGSFCAPDCTVDIGPGCEFWASKGLCQVATLARYCGKTCNYCQPFFPIL